MKKIKQRSLCLLLCVCICSSLFMLYANAIEPLDGTIDADDDATLIKPTLEVSTTPTGAVAVGYDMFNDSEHYYRVNGNILSLNHGVEIFTEQGWLPDDNGASLNNIIDNDGDGDPEDDRGIFVSPTTNPYRTIALVEAYYRGISTPFYGTATMISSDVAVTAAHCLYDEELGGWPWKVVVTPAIVGMNNTNEAYRTKPFGSSEAEELVISTLFYEGLNTSNELDADYHDWGMIRLEDEIGNQSGYLGFQYKTGNMETDVGEPQCTIVGYPGDLNGYDEDTYLYERFTQYYATGDIFRDTRGSVTADNGTTHEWRLFEHEIDATDGQSGSAVLFPDTTATRGYVIIGIYTGYYLGYNRAMGITSQLYSFMLAYK